MSKTARKAAVQIIYNVLKNSNSLSDELTLLRDKKDYSSLDLRFVTEISVGVIRKLEYLDYIISKNSSVPLKKISPYIMCVLRLGVYQLLFMDKVPASAAVNESVKLIKSSSNRNLAGFVNAVLRSVQRRDNCEYDFPVSEIKNISIRYSCPQWLVMHYKDIVGDQYIKLLEAFSQKSRTMLRVNQLKTSTSELCDILRQEGWQCEKYVSPVFPDIDYLVSADKITDIRSSKAYLDGLFYIQDCAGAYVSEALKPSPGSLVLDMCASPGGKTTHMAELMKNKGKIIAFDVSDSKVSKINENAKRLGIETIEARKGDSSIFDSSLEGKADYILVDAPCSGLGIIRKKPDIKYLRKKEDIDMLSAISSSILDTSARYLKPGGTLAFSTCTLSKAENENVLFEFLKRNTDFHLKKIPCAKNNDGYITLYPHLDDSDGFFISLLTKD